MQKVRDEHGMQLDAEYDVEEIDGIETIVFSSRGGGLNNDYNKGLFLVLKRIQKTISAIYLERKHEKTPLEERLLIIENYPYPISHISDPDDLRKSIGKASAKTRRESTTQGGGNPQKRIRIYLDSSPQHTTPEKQQPIKRIPLESIHTRTYTVQPQSEHHAERNEQYLLLRYASFLASRNYTTHRHEYKTGEGSPLYSDLYIEQTQSIVEAKFEATRNNIRMAIGQLFDYQRYHQEPVSLGVLLSQKPNDDLMALLQLLNITVIWEENATFFSTDNRFGRVCS